MGTDMTDKEVAALELRAAHGDAGALKALTDETFRARTSEARLARVLGEAVHWIKPGMHFGDPMAVVRWAEEALDEVDHGS